MCVGLVCGQDGGVAVIGNHGVDDDDYILSPGTDTEHFNQSIVIIVIAAEYDLFQAFHTDMERLDVPETTIRQFPVNNSPHASILNG